MEFRFDAMLCSSWAKKKLMWNIFSSVATVAFVGLVLPNKIPSSPQIEI